MTVDSAGSRSLVVATLIGRKSRVVTDIAVAESVLVVAAVTTDLSSGWTIAVVVAAACTDLME